MKTTPRPGTLACIDRRTREGRLLDLVRAELTKHVGGNPSAVQRMLIDQAAQLKLRLAAMDRKFVEAGAMAEHDSRVYLAWSNSLSRLMRQLGLRPGDEQPPDLAAILAQTAARRATTARDGSGHTDIRPAPHAASGALAPAVAA